MHPPTQTHLPRRITFLGLGVMGYPMAGHLAHAGHQVTVYNRTASQADKWCRAYPGQQASTPYHAAQHAEIVIACVGNDADLRSITLGDHGAFASMANDALFIDHTTASAEVARELYQIARSRQLHFIDAPVSGGQAGAQQACLSVMCGGDLVVFERAAPTLRHYAQTVTYIGETGAGQLAKMVNQICIAGILQGLAEALHFGERAGLDMQAVLQAINLGAASSWQMQHRAQTMLKRQFDFGFAVDWMRKDLGLCLAAAHSVGAALPSTALTDQFYATVQALGGGRLDTSSLILHLLSSSPKPSV